jgi:RIO-like serine/threonine protein kinase
MTLPAALPPLPPRWPFAARTPGGALVERAGELPGLGGGWSLRLVGALPLEGAEGTLAFGRGGIRRVGAVVIRPYRRGGLVRHLNERIYPSPRRFEQEFGVHRALWAAGFPTVEPLGFAWRRRLWGVEGAYLTRHAEAQPWPACWERTAEVVPQLAVLLRALADWGLHAPDLNATNVLLAPDGRVLALDWDRARWTGGADLLARYRERLERSLRKLKAPLAVSAALEASLSA